MSEHASSAVLHERLLARLRMRHLHLVGALASSGHLGRAAASIHVTQPAATQMLHEIESLLELRLFERHARGMRATPAGEVLAAQARTMLDALRVVSDTAAARSKDAQRALRVGALPAAVASLLHPSMPALMRSSGMRLQLIEDSGERLLAGLASGAFDMVLLRQPPQVASGQRFVALLKDRMVVIAAPSHPAAQRARVRWRDLAGSRWLLPPEHYAVRPLIEAALKRAKIAPIELAVQTVIPALIGPLLAGGDVLSAAPRSIIDTLQPGTVVELKVALHAPLEPLGALYRVERDGSAPPGLDAFLGMLKGTAS